MNTNQFVSEFTLRIPCGLYKMPFYLLSTHLAVEAVADLHYFTSSKDFFFLLVMFSRRTFIAYKEVFLLKTIVPVR